METDALDFTAMETTDTAEAPLESPVESLEHPVDAQETQAENVDGRRGPANIRNSIKAASEALPEQAQAFKDLGNAYFREQAYKQHFATP